MSDHGTESRYSRGCRCAPCRQAASAAKRRRREASRVPCSHGCGRYVDSINRSDPDKPYECQRCATRRLRTARVIQRRTPVVTDLHLVERARGLHAAGLSFRAIAVQMDVSHTTVQRWLDQRESDARTPLSSLPPRETLTSQQGTDGRWHAHYPSATRTLCGRDVLPPVIGGKLPPDCGKCAKTARRFHRIEPCQPAHWLPEYEAA